MSPVISMCYISKISHFCNGYNLHHIVYFIEVQFSKYNLFPDPLSIAPNDVETKLKISLHAFGQIT
jgi:hypothetical protein